MIYRKVLDVQASGIDINTLENDSFPQLKIETSLMVKQLFSDLKMSLDQKTGKKHSIYYLNLLCKDYLTSNFLLNSFLNSSRSHSMKRSIGFSK